MLIRPIMISVGVRRLKYHHDVIIDGAQGSRLIIAKTQNMRGHMNRNHQHGRREMARTITVRPELVLHCEGRTEGLL